MENNHILLSYVLFKYSNVFILLKLFIYLYNIIKIIIKISILILFILLNLKGEEKNEIKIISSVFPPFFLSN